MRSFLPSLSGIAPLALLLTQTAAQTWSSCNPLYSTCPANPALGTSMSFDFANGNTGGFTAKGGPVGFDSDGATFTVAASGQAPQLDSNWYIMFGHVELTLKTSPGVGIVSSVVLQSDTLDEIDWEWLGADPDQVQTNYFGKGFTGDYDRGGIHSNPANQDVWHTYAIDWTPERIVWQVDGQTLRTLTAEAAGNQYPQSPMQLKMGSWSGGDSNNEAGTIRWAGGKTDYSQGPFVMRVRSGSVTDYSTGTSYRFSDNSGSWKSVVSEGGAVLGVANTGGTKAVETAAPAVTSVAVGAKPFYNNREPDESTRTRTGYPWTSDSQTQTSAPSSSKVAESSSAKSSTTSGPQHSSSVAVPSSAVVPESKSTWVPTVVPGGNTQPSGAFTTLSTVTQENPPRQTSDRPIPIASNDGAVFGGSFMSACVALLALVAAF